MARIPILQIKIRLDADSMTDFGQAVHKIGVEFPALILADAEEVRTMCANEAIDRPSVEAMLARLVANAQAATQIGNAVATLIGLCQPERIDGGPVQ